MFSSISLTLQGGLILTSRAMVFGDGAPLGGPKIVSPASPNRHGPGVWRAGVVDGVCVFMVFFCLGSDVAEEMNLSVGVTLAPVIIPKVAIP